MEEEESDTEENKANVSEKILSGDYEVCINKSVHYRNLYL